MSRFGRPYPKPNRGSHETLKVITITINRGYGSEKESYIKLCFKSAHVLESFYQCIQRFLLRILSGSPASKGSKQPI